MRIAASTIEEAREFLGARRIAVVGVSRDPKSFSRSVFRELLRRGYDAVPVNPALREADGRKAYAWLTEVAPPPEAALVMTAPWSAAEVVRDCIAAGVRSVWLHRGSGAGSASRAAVDLARAAGLHLIVGLCPMMALPDTGWFHRMHGAFRTRRSREAACAQAASKA